MRLLLDTHVVLALLRKTAAAQFPEISRRLADPQTTAVISVASLWETAIKTRLGKLDPGLPLDEIADYLEASGFSILPITARHAVVAADPRDPFDRLLLAQCQVEGMQLVTVDRVLLQHPLALSIRQ